MSYENPDLPEGINLPRGNPFRDFFIQGGAALALLIGLVYAIYEAGHILGPHIPFEWEQQLSEIALRDFPLTTEGAPAEARREVLQRLTDEIVPFMDLPEGMTITIHYSDQPIVNAFATFGGHIVIFEGLIARLPSENALAMVIGHEISHVKNRDVVSGMSGAILVQFITALATGDSGLASEIVGNVQLLTELSYTRAAEERSDREGMRALYGHYGHVNGYRQTFDALIDWLNDAGGQYRELPEFLRSHPDSNVRIAKLEAFAAENGFPVEGDLKPLRQANFPPEKLDPWGIDAGPGAPPIKVKPRDGAETLPPADVPTPESEAGSETAPADEPLGKGDAKPTSLRESAPETEMSLAESEANSSNSEATEKTAALIGADDRLTRSAALKPEPGPPARILPRPKPFAVVGASASVFELPTARLKLPRERPAALAEIASSTPKKIPAPRERPEIAAE